MYGYLIIIWPQSGSSLFIINFNLLFQTETTQQLRPSSSCSVDKVTPSMSGIVKKQSADTPSLSEQPAAPAAPARSTSFPFLNRRKDPPLTRTIEARVASHEYGSNAIRSAKYTWLNMLPKAIFEQFRRVSNFYFLIVAAVSFIPNISPSSPVTTTLPLLVVIGFGLARDVYEDLLRKKADAESNNRPVIIRNRLPQSSQQHPVPELPSSSSASSASIDYLLSSCRSLDKRDYSIIRSRDVAVGDVLVVTEGMHIPADLVVLSCANSACECFVSTANLDGESNLKRRRAPYPSLPSSPQSSQSSQPRKSSQPPLKMEKKPIEYSDPLSAIITISAPTPSLYEIEGSMRRAADKPPTPLDDRNVLLRGSVLRNTPFIQGIVIYTGSDTKLALNMRNAPSKLGGIERMMNRIVITLFTLLLVITAVTATIAGVWHSRYGLGQWYMGENRLLSSTTVALRSLGTFIILYHTFVPVSLFVTLEFVRLVQGWFITGDVFMSHKDGLAEVKANNLNECLGYVDHIFTDKTGTLTQNEMKFVAAVTPDGHMADFMGNLAGLKRDIQRTTRPQLSHLLNAIAITHDLMPVETEAADENDSDATTIDYQGESVDEIALLKGAQQVGVALIERSSDGTTIIKNADDGFKRFTILTILEFTSERKRMSVVARSQENGEIWIFSKGADSAMLPLLRTSQPESEVAPATQTTEISEIKHGIEQMSRNGLRTLVYAQRTIGDEEYTAWKHRYEDAANAMEDRAERKAALAMEIEQGLECIGVTGVEDKLQDEVGNCITFFRMAGMRIWVVTGDKVETAENIGYSTRLLNEQMKVTILTQCTSEDELEILLQKHDPVDADDGTIEHSLIIDGETLKIVEESKNEALEKKLIQVAMHCKTVICARVTPLQKANVVLTVRRHHKDINTLAIGDGGNDVSMIQQAHIGIGIKGKEGSQAARAADYALMEFKHLKRLLAIHGRYSYLRTAGVINLSFYKNVFFSCTQFLFQWFCFGSGTTIHNQWIVTGWNSILTLLPPFIFGIFERDLDEITLLRFPFAYDTNRRNRLFNLATVVEFTVGYSTFHAMVLFWFTFILLGNTNQTIFSSGQDAGFFLIGLCISFMALCIALFKFLLTSHLWTRFVIGGVSLSFALLWGLVSLFPTLFHETPLEGVMSKMVSSGTFHLVWPLIFVTAFIPDFVVRLWRSSRGTNVVENLQKYETQQRKQKA